MKTLDLPKIRITSEPRSARHTHVRGKLEEASRLNEDMKNQIRKFINCSKLINDKLQEKIDYFYAPYKLDFRQNVEKPMSFEPRIRSLSPQIHPMTQV